MRVTRHEEFEMAHILPGYPGGCKNLHGHTYKIEVTIEGPQNEEKWGMVLDFNILKKVIKEVVPDHKFAYNSINPSNVEKDLLSVLNEYGCETVGFPFCTTAENMCQWFADVIEQKLINEYDIFTIKVAEVKLWETTNSYATYLKR